ncbi:MAG: methionine adenosyltransferase [Myxococcota bacterium]
MSPQPLDPPRTRQLILRSVDAPPTGKGRVEVAERKGIGHPDTLCDGVAEAVSVALSRHYLERFGRVLHHNVDKVLLRGGRARAHFGGGEVIEPIDLYLAGRVTKEHRGVRVPVDELAVEACRSWLGAHLRTLDVERHIVVHPLFRPGSAELIDVFERPRTGAPLANDTSCGVGFAPLTSLERAVLAAEAALNDPQTKKRHPELGEDVKVMGIRRGASVELTVSCAFIAVFVQSSGDYLRKKELAREMVASVTGAQDVVVNAADDLEHERVYLTVTGTSAESGDDGQTGRGNRANGLITPYRPMTLEAAAGKNPLSHVGKLYQLAAGRIANDSVQLSGVREAFCVLVSQIGRPVDQPQLVDLALRLQPGESIEQHSPRLAALVRDHLAELPTLWRALLEGNQRVY